MEYEFYIQARYQIKHLIDLTGALITSPWWRHSITVCLNNASFWNVTLSTELCSVSINFWDGAKFGG